MSAGFLAVLSDVLALTKLSLMRTVPVIGDDMALNAKQLSHVPSEREIPIIKEVAKGSLVNKAKLTPLGLGLSRFAKPLIQPLLMVGGAYFCHEGVEKLMENWQHRHAPKPAHAENLPAQFAGEENERIRQAVKTDFVLSAEIVALTLGMVSKAPMETQIITMVASGLIMTGLVYGSVACLVRMDEAGLHLKGKDHPVRHFGHGMLTAAPWILKGLTFAGTVAMFTVGGGLLVDGAAEVFAPVHHLVEHVSQMAGSVPHIGGLLKSIASTALDGVGGLMAGITTVSATHGLKKIFRGEKPVFLGEYLNPAPDDPEPDMTPAPVKPSPAVRPVPDAGNSFAQAAVPTDGEKPPVVKPEVIPPAKPAPPAAHIS